MAVNKYRPHVLVLPEDDANRQIAVGFQLNASLAARAIDVLPPAGGWTNVLDDFRNNHLVTMSRYPYRHMVLLVDFDGDVSRLDTAKAVIPESLAERVFVLGALSEPEDLRKARLGTFEAVGRELARDCQDGSTTLWDHELLRHNAEELKRMTPILRPILFPPD